MKNTKEEPSEKSKHQSGYDQRLEEIQVRIRRLEEGVLEGKLPPNNPPVSLAPRPPKFSFVFDVDRILKYPRRYGSGYTWGLGSLTLGDLIRKKVREGTVTLAELQEKLQLPPEEFERLQKDQLMPTEDIIKNLLAPLQVSYSDINTCRARTIRKIKGIHTISRAAIELLSTRRSHNLRMYLGDRAGAKPLLSLGNEIIKPCGVARFSEALNHFQQNTRYFVFGFTANLFLENTTGDVQSANPLHYRRKKEEEMQAILALRKTSRIVVLEYPTRLVSSPNSHLKFICAPQLLIRAVQHYRASFFARINLNEETRFHNVRLVQIGSDWIVKIVCEAKTEEMPLENFLEQWKQTAFEGIVVARDNIFPEFLATLIDEMEEKTPGLSFFRQYLQLDAMQALTRSTAYAERLLEQGAFMSVIPAVYPAFPSKWLEPMPGGKEKGEAQRLCYVIQPSVPQSPTV